MESALGIDVPFSLPVISRGVALDRGIDAQVGTVAAAGFPSLTLEGIRAMAAEQPGIVKR